MRGEEIFAVVERTNELEDKRLNGGMSEKEVIEYNNIKRKTQLFSIDDFKEYHNYVRKLLKNVAEIEKELLKQFSEVCSPGSLKVIEEIVKDVCGSNLYMKGFWGRT
jgi:hypothetical protein